MKCGNCDNFVFGKCKDDRCYGGCEIDSKNRTVHMEQECIVDAEDLICIEFDGGEREWVVARSENEALQYYEETTGYDPDEMDVSLITKWHDIQLRVETDKGREDTTFLEYVKDSYDPETFEPYIIASTCY